MIKKIFGSKEIIVQMALIISIVSFGISLAAFSIGLLILLGVRHGV